MKNISIKIVLLTIFALFSAKMSAQFVGAGSSSYAYLNLPTDARVMALGGTNVSVGGYSIASTLCNPALLSERSHMTVQASFGYLMPGTMFGTAMYGYSLNQNHWAVGVQYLSNGKIYEANSDGYLTGKEYGLNDVAIHASYSRTLSEMFRVGVTLKPVISSYAGWTSFALGADVGGHFQTKDSCLQIGLTLRNIGWQLKTYYPERPREMLPLDLQLGISYRIPKVPVRFGLTIHNLQAPRLDYDYTNRYTPQISDERESGNISTADMVFRHTIWYIDLCPSDEKWWVTLSYNHRRRQEMNLTDQKSVAGFALGAGANIKGLQVGIAASQLAKNYFNVEVTLGVNVDQVRQLGTEHKAKKANDAKLSDEEKARIKAEEKARKAEERARRRAESEARQEEITRKLRGL